MWEMTCGSYINNLVLTDIASGWTECVAPVVRENKCALEHILHCGSEA